MNVAIQMKRSRRMRMAGIQEYRCPFCGSMIVFNDFSHMKHCPYCGSKINMEAKDVEVEEKQEPIVSQKPEEPQNIQPKEEEANISFMKYVCESCHSEMEANDENEHKACPYCGGIMKPHERKTFDQPDFIIPFQQTKEDAKRTFQALIKGKSLLPEEYRSADKIDSIQGVYIPFWIFDYDMNGKLNYQTTKSTYWNDAMYKYNKKEEYQVLREGTMEFESIQLCASSKIPENYVKAITPFDLNTAIPFDIAHTNGYNVQKFDVEFLDMKKQIENKMADCIMKELEHTVKGYQTRNATKREVEIADLDINYVLFPMWIVSTTHNGKAYTFIMNGQTGKYVGDIPVDKRKYWIHFSLYFLVAFLSVLLVTMLVL